MVDQYTKPINFKKFALPLIADPLSSRSSSNDELKKA